ncbi:hypothetical protein IEU95_08645 [Hoyosella rhizosphaerae]|uniref:Uncharacterized protein n=1 Tax=Hoyosella rhizosphaerae TaxID=1755582 RepID=A0A916U145_9ACTN|nr:hypothetical protein [Hoyosella rhizosphaerae]MBN4926897.1 hypothetical protein [Hoyosella rhizosphaerae]GGC55657.1 hypothetical protein GCM10011410_05070 [Hoyosella rhizosphaerae]
MLAEAEMKPDHGHLPVDLPPNGLAYERPASVEGALASVVFEIAQEIGAQGRTKNLISVKAGKSLVVWIPTPPLSFL